MSPATIRAILTLAGSEVRLLWRNRLVASTALVIPLATAGGYAASGLQFGDGWGGTVGFMVLTMLRLTVYMSATTAVAARRSGLVLKRLRSGETPQWAILAGMLLPTLVLSVVQSVLIGGMFLAFDAGTPEQPLVVLGAAVGGAAMCAALALAAIALVVWTALALDVAIRTFRWEPRAA